MNPHIGIPLDQYLQENIGLVKDTATRFMGWVKANKFEFDDLLQIATIGFIKAYHTYDPTKPSAKNAKFVTHAMIHIQGQLYKAVRETQLNVHFAYSTTINAKRIRREELSGETNPRIVAEALNIPVWRAKEAMICSLNIVISSMDEVACSSDEHKDTDQYDKFSCEDDLSFVNLDDFLSMLPEKERIIVVMRMQDRIQREIGETLGLSQVQVFRLIKESIAPKLINYLEGRKLNARLA